MTDKEIIAGASHQSHLGNRGQLDPPQSLRSESGWKELFDKEIYKEILGVIKLVCPNANAYSGEDQLALDLHNQIKDFISQALKKQRAEIREEIALLHILGKGIDNGIHNSALQQALNISPLKENE